MGNLDVDGQDKQEGIHWHRCRVGFLCVLISWLGMPKMPCQIRCGKGWPPTKEIFKACPQIQLRRSLPWCVCMCVSPTSELLMINDGSSRSLMAAQGQNTRCLHKIRRGDLQIACCWCVHALKREPMPKVPTLPIPPRDHACITHIGQCF